VLLDGAGKDACQVLAHANSLSRWPKPKGSDPFLRVVEG
jgi:hypothetical protein